MKKITNLGYGVDRVFLENKRFNTTLISINFYLPLNKEGLSLYSVLSGVMASSCAAYPDFSELNLRQKELYSATIGALSEKVGDRQLIKFVATFLNNDVVLEDIESKVSNLLLELIFNPLIEDGGFKESEVSREKRLIQEKIKSLINEKRAYSINKTIEKMFCGTPYATSRYGDIEDIKKIDGKALYDAYIHMLKNAYIRIQITGKEYNGRFDEAFKKAIAPFRTEKDFSLPRSCAKQNDSVTEFSEKAPINQAKLCLGFTSEKISDNPAITVFADIFGGGPYSLLFSNVREKLSLCYYCAARPTKNKGFLMVDSGVKKANIEKAKNQILLEKEKIENGEFDDNLIATSKKAILESLKGNNDSDLVLDTWYSLRESSDLFSPEEFSERLMAVTKEEVIMVAKEYKLDTVFALLPEDQDEN